MDGNKLDVEKSLQETIDVRREQANTKGKLALARLSLLHHHLDPDTAAGQASKPVEANLSVSGSTYDLLPQALPNEEPAAVPGDAADFESIDCEDEPYTAEEDSLK